MNFWEFADKNPHLTFWLAFWFLFFTSWAVANFRPFHKGDKEEHH
jgi:hypothetical protein